MAVLALGGLFTWLIVSMSREASAYGFFQFLDEGINAGELGFFAFFLVVSAVCLVIAWVERKDLRKAVARLTLSTLRALSACFLVACMSFGFLVSWGELLLFLPVSLCIAGFLLLYPPPGRQPSQFFSQVD
jgi:membrane-anchored protein YejM (alkaline phosphatase superfamily)